MDDKLVCGIMGETDTDYIVRMIRRDGKHVDILIPKSSDYAELWSSDGDAKPFGLNLVTSGHYA